MKKVDLLASIDALCNETAIYMRSFTPAYRRVPMQDDADAEVLREMYYTAGEMLGAIPEDYVVPQDALTPLFEGAHARIPFMAQNEDQAVWLQQHVVDWEQAVLATYEEGGVT